MGKGVPWLARLQRRFEPRAGRADVAVALQQISLMLAVGISLPDAMEILGREGEHPRLRRVFDEVARDICLHGHSFSGAAAKHPDIFSGDTLLMIKAGEQSGDFAHRLRRAAELLERQARMISEVKRSLTAPLFTTVTCLVVLFLLVKFVLPRFTDMYASLQVQLPFISRLVIACIKTLDHPVTLATLSVSVVLLYLWRYHLKEWLFDTGLRFRWSRKMIGNLLCVHFMDVLASINRDGIPIDKGLEMLERTAPFRTYARDLRRVTERLYDEGSLSTAVESVPYFPPVVATVLMVGEESGRLVHSLQTTCVFIESQNEVALSQAVDLLEPIMIAIMGIIMGVICVGMFLPIYSVLGKF